MDELCEPKTVIWLISNQYFQIETLVKCQLVPETVLKQNVSYSGNNACMIFTVFVMIPSSLIFWLYPLFYYFDKYSREMSVNILFSVTKLSLYLKQLAWKKVQKNENFQAHDG